jgi:hypothetical protein
MQTLPPQVARQSCREQEPALLDATQKAVQCWGRISDPPNP